MAYFYEAGSEMFDEYDESAEYEEMICAADEMKAKARKSRKARRIEKEKANHVYCSRNLILGPRTSKRMKRAWHKAQRRAEEPCRSYKGRYSFDEVVWALT